MDTRARLVALLAVACVGLMPACAHRAGEATATATTSATTTTFVLVRHGEKAASDPVDPPLAPAGVARAGRLVGLLEDEPLAAIYATGFRRTQDTAAPIARARSLAVSTYDARGPAEQFAERLRRDHRSGTVLVVGHSNTVPAIAAALCACTVAPMPESEYGRYFRLVAPADGAQPAQLQVLSW